MITLTIEVEPEIARILEEAAREKGVAVKALVAEQLAQYAHRLAAEKKWQKADPVEQAKSFGK